MEKNPHPHGASCWTPSQCAAREALDKLRKIATERHDAELLKLVNDLAAAILPADEQQPAHVPAAPQGQDRRANGWPAYLNQAARP